MRCVNRSMLPSVDRSCCNLRKRILQLRWNRLAQFINNLKFLDFVQSDLHICMPQDAVIPYQGYRYAHFANQPARVIWCTQTATTVSNRVSEKFGLKTKTYAHIWTYIYITLRWQDVMNEISVGLVLCNFHTWLLMQYYLMFIATPHDSVWGQSVLRLVNDEMGQQLQLWNFNRCCKSDGQ